MSLLLLLKGGIPATQITASDSVAVSASDVFTAPIPVRLGIAPAPVFESNFDEFGENVAATEAGFQHHVVSGTPTSIASIGSTFALNGGKGMRIRTDDTWRHFLYKTVNSSYIRLETLWRRADSPSASTQIFSVRSVAGLTATTPVAGVRISSNPYSFQLYNGSTLVATSGTGSVLNQIYKLVYRISGGTQRLDIFTDVNANTEVDTPFESISGAIATGPYELFGFGSFSSTSTAFIYSQYDDMKIETAAPGTGLISETRNLAISEIRKVIHPDYTNILHNPSFEEGLGDWAILPEESFGGAATLEVIDGDARDGTKKLRVTVTTTGPFTIASEKIPTLQSETYLGLGFSARQTAGTPIAISGRRARYRNDATFLGITGITGAGGTMSSTWTRWWGSGTFTQTSTDYHAVALYFNNATAGDVYEIDAVQLEKQVGPFAAEVPYNPVAPGGAEPISGTDSSSLSASETSQVDVTGIDLPGTDSTDISIVETSQIVQKGNQIGKPDGTGLVVGEWFGSYLDVDETVPNDNDYIESSTNPAAEDLYTVTLSPMDFPEDGPHTVRFRYSKSANAGRNIQLQVQLRQGDSTTITDRDVGIISDATWQESVYTLSPEEVALITDYQDLRFRFIPTASGGGQGRSARISWVEIEIPPVAPPVETSVSDTGGIAVSETSQITEVITKSASDTPSFGVVETYQGHDLVIQGGLKQVIMASDAGTMTSQYNSAPFNITTGDKIIVVVQAFETDATDTFASASALGVTWNGTNILKYGFKGHIHIMEGTATQTRSTTLSVDRSPITNPWTVTALLFGEGANIGALPTATLTGGSQPRVNITPTFAERQILFTAMSDELDGTGHPTQFDYLAVEGELPNEIYFRDVAGGFGNTYVALYGNTSGPGPYTVGLEFPGIWSWWAAAVEIESVYSAVEWEVPSEPIAGSETTAISISEASSLVINNYPTASDSAALAVADASTSFRTISANDSQGLRITDIGNIGSTLPGTETTTIGVAETSAVSVVINRTDESTLAVTETRTQSSTFTRTDTGAIAIVDTSATAKSSSVFDITGLSVSETSSGVITAIASDASAIAVTEVATAGTSLPGTETTAIGVTETVVINVTQAASDASALSLAEQTTSAITVSRTDTGSISVADTTDTALTVNVTDTTSIAVTESVTTFKDIIKVGTDTSTIAVADTSSSYRAVPVSDTGVVAVTDISNIGSTLPGTEVNTIGLAETTVINVVVASVDASGVAATETRVQNVTVARTDTAALTVVDAPTNNLTSARTDTATVSITDASTVLKTLIASDTASIAVNEVTGFASDLPGTEITSVFVTEETNIFVVTDSFDNTSVTTTETRELAKSSAAVDTVALTIAETRTIASTSSRTDTSAISVSETSQVLLSDLKTASDATSINVAETTEFATVARTSADVGEVSVTEDTAFVRTLVASDSIGLAIVETSTPFSDFPGQDSSSLAITETNFIIIAGSFTRTASDSAAVAATDASVLTVNVQASDGATVSITDTSAAPFIGGGLNINAADSRGLRITETTSRAFFLNRSDTSGLRITDTSTGSVSAVASDSGGIAVEDSSTGFHTLAADDSSNISVTDTGVRFKNFPGTDAAGLRITETSEVTFEGVLEKEASDSLTINGSDVATMAVNLSGADAGALSVLEAHNFDLTPTTAAEMVPVSLSEASQTLVTISRTDSATLIVSEARGFESVTRADSDTGQIAAVESAQVQALWPGVDHLTIGIEEESAVEVSGSFTRSASDTLKVVLETTTDFVKDTFLSRNDTAGLTVSEEIAFSPSAFTTTDNIHLNVSEFTAKAMDLFAEDVLTLSLTEASLTSTHEGFSTFESTDSVAIRISDWGRLWYPGAVNVPISFASSTKSGIIINVAGRSKSGFGTSHERNKHFE